MNLDYCNKAIIKSMFDTDFIDLGNWIKAIIKSIFYTALLIPLYLAFKVVGPSNPWFYAIGIPFISFYLLISFIGWLFIGFPTHWLICKYTSRSYFSYILAPLIFTLAPYCWFSDLKTTIIYGTFALAQVLLFRYYVYKQ